MTALQKISQGEIPPKKTTDSAIARQFLACHRVVFGQCDLHKISSYQITIFHLNITFQFCPFSSIFGYFRVSWLERLRECDQ